MFPCNYLWWESVLIILNTILQSLLMSSDAPYIQLEIFTWSIQSWGGPCFTPLRDGRQTSTRHSKGCRSRRKNLGYESQSYLRMLSSEGWGGKGGCSSTFWGHIKVVQWAPIGQLFFRRWCLLFITNTFKDAEAYRPLWVTRFLLFFTGSPNNMHACM